MSDSKINSRTGLCLEWTNLNYSVSAKEQTNYNCWRNIRKDPEVQLLSNVSGHMQTGDLVAILGCSGAGKTTLLAAISQRLRGNLKGEIVLNGVAVNRDDMRRISSFLPQFEINVKTFTPYEHLYFMSHFKMHRNTTKAEKRQRVNDLLLAVGLRDAAHTRIQQLSGGERKRLSLAEELITDPPFLFCDEPTTGLDSFSAYSMVKTLRHLCTRHRVVKTSLASIYGDDSYTTPSENSSHDSIEMEIMPSNENLFKDLQETPALSVLAKGPNAHHKKAIICSIHQPTSDVFELFTHIILMDSGRILYQGSTEKALKFFTDLGFELQPNCNPAEFYVRTIADKDNDVANRIKSKFDQETVGLYTGSWLLPRHHSGDYLRNFQEFQKINWFYQVYLLFIRVVTEDCRNIKEGIINLTFFMITSVTLSVMYSELGGLTQTSIQDIDGSIFMLSTEMIFTFSYGICYVFPLVLPIMRREVGEGTYRLSALYVAIFFSFIPVAFFKSYLFFGVVYSSIYLSRGFLLYLKMGFILSLAAIAAVGYGLFLSSLFESTIMAGECAAPFDLIFLIFSGAYYNVDSIPILKYFSLFFYANEGLMYNYWIDVDTIECSPNLEHPCITNGIEVLERASFKTGEYTFLFDSFGLICVAIAFNIVAYVLIRRYVKRSGYY